MPSVQNELVPEEPHNVPAVTVDPVSAYAPPMQSPQAYWDQPSMRLSPHPDPYHRYPGMSPYPMGDNALTHGQLQAHDPYYSRAALPYQPNAGLALAPHPSMHSQSPGSVYTVPQRPEGGQVRADFRFLESDVPSRSNWDKGSAHHLETPPLPGPPLPPKPIELVSTIAPTSATSEQPHLTPPSPLAAVQDTLPVFNGQQDPSQHVLAVSPPNKAPEPLALFPLDETHESSERESPEHVPQDEH
jgi:hypothetical protein